MSWYKNLSRREFIQLGAAAAVAAGATSCSNPQIPWRFLTLNEARTLAALCDQIIPPDHDPGAQWASVVNYIDIQLCGPYQDLQQVYRDGLAQLNKLAVNHGQRDFAALPAESQLALLNSIEKCTASNNATVSASQESFFQLVVEHTMQGFYGDPRHGGNRDRVSWRMLALPYPPVRGQQRYGGSKGQP